MAELTPEIAGDVVSACRAALDEITASFVRAFDGQSLSMTVGDATTHIASAPPPEFDGPGLAIVLRIGETGAVGVLPESSGLLPAWCAKPDTTGTSKLNTLAQELGMMVVPESVAFEQFHAIHVVNLGHALAKAEVAQAAALVPLVFRLGEKEGQFSFIWPVAKPHSLLEQTTKPAPAAPAAPAAPIAPIERMPEHLRSFLKIDVPLSVFLASQKQTVQEILSLVPGSIIKFDKGCEEMLELVAGDQPIAEGEVVKVGDKFGLRIRSMILPQERFVAIDAKVAAG